MYFLLLEIKQIRLGIHKAYIDDKLEIDASRERCYETESNKNYY